LKRASIAGEKRQSVNDRKHWQLAPSGKLINPVPARPSRLDAQGPQERLRPSQSTGERPRIFFLPMTCTHVLASTLRRQAPEMIGCTPAPHRAVDHDYTHASRYRMCLDDARSRPCGLPWARANAPHLSGFFDRRSRSAFFVTLPMWASVHSD